MAETERDKEKDAETQFVSVLVNFLISIYFLVARESTRRLKTQYF